MNTLSTYEIEFLTNLIKKREPLPEDYKYKLFPTKQKEYELVYANKMRKEDVLSNEDGVFPAPLQIDKVFNCNEDQDEWNNMLIFGDNLQFLKTIYSNQDPLIKQKVKGKVKLIYIDPPFATEEDFRGSKGEKAYTDKIKGAEFVEFLRRRLIVAKEILADDGSILVHLDWKKVHYIKLVLDEVFGEENFINEIIWKRKGGSANPKNRLGVVTDTILWYSKTNNYKVNQQYTLESDEVKKYINERFNNIDEDGRKFLKSPIVSPNPRENLTYEYKGYKPPKNGWSISKKIMEQWDKEGKLYFPDKKNGKRIYRKIYEDEYQGQPIQNLWTDIYVINPMAQERIGYPTQKPELLIKRIIETCTNEGDLVLDFFAGSGTTVAVAEKLNRRWIACDIGRLAFYTIQKRLLTISESKSFENPKKNYNKNTKSFITASAGVYELGKIFELKKNEYIDFVTKLFDIDKVEKRINGVRIDGEKNDGYDAMIYPYWDFKDSIIDEDYIEHIHSNIGGKIGSRFYIVAPANYVSFITDYYEIEDTRYYFLKVPYQIIQELHKVQFKKLRQPQSENNVNSLENTVGFHFIRPPKVNSFIKVNDVYVNICINSFYSSFTEEETGRDMNNFESLAMVLVDVDYKENNFIMKKYYFAKDLISQDINIKDESKIKKELRSRDNLLITIDKKECGPKIMIIYIDIYGNEFKEVFNLGE